MNSAHSNRRRSGSSGSAGSSSKSDSPKAQSKAKEKTEQPVVVITGAAGGIGEAIVLRCLEEGARVFATDLPERIEGLRTAIAATLGKSKKSERRGDITFCAMDVGDRNSIQEAYRKVMSLWGRVDALVNSAGIFQERDWKSLGDDDFKRILDINLIGALRTSQIFSPIMLELKKGKIIHISSAAAHQSLPQSVHYAASKAALVSLGRSMAHDLAQHGIQVNTLLPGYIDTPLLQSNQNLLKTWAAFRTPTKRLGYAWEVAEAVWFLIVCESAYLTGSSLVIDGGLGLG